MQWALDQPPNHTKRNPPTCRPTQKRSASSFMIQSFFYFTRIIYFFIFATQLQQIYTKTHIADILKKKKPLSNKTMSQALSLLLIFLFLFISAAQILHTHDGQIKIEQSGNQNNLDQKHDCKVCDYLLDHPSKQLFLTHPPLTAVPLPEVVLVSTGVFARIYKFTLQGFTNKGPPVRI